MAMNYIKGLLLWLIPINNIVILGCYGIWRWLARAWELKASGITIYRWLKAVLVIWSLPLLFLAVNFYLQNRVGWGVTDGDYFPYLLPVRYIDSVLLIIWGIGVLVQFIRCLIVWIKDRRTVYRLPLMFHMGWENDAAAVAADFGIRRKVQLRLGPSDGSPQMVGICRPVVVISRMDLTSQERRIVLYHELSHYKHGDLWWQIAMELMICLNWFNPICHRLRQHMTLWCETACDAWACRQRKDQFTLKDYGETVLSFCMRRRSNGKGLARTMGEAMTAEGFIRRIKRLCVADQIWKEKNYRPACCVALIMLMVLLTGAGGVYGAGQTSNALAQKKEVVQAEGKPIPFPEPQLTRVKPSAMGELNENVIEVTPDERCLQYRIEVGEVLKCSLRPGADGEYAFIVMGDEDYEIYFCDEGRQVWHGYIERVCRIPERYIAEGKTVYIQIRNLGSEQSAGIIGWQVSRS